MIITGFMLFPFLSLSAQTSWDLRLNNRAQITTPAAGSPSQFCSSASSNLIFQVTNDGPDNLVLATVSMTATLTLTGNTFSPSGSNVATNAFTTNTFPGSQVQNEIRSGQFAVFTWPSPLQFASTGITTVTIEVAPFSGTDAIANNTQSYVVTVQANPTQPTLTSNYGNGTISICQGASVELTSSAVGDEYEFYRNGVLLGPRQASVSFITTNLNNNDVVNVIAFFTSNCSSVNSAPINVIAETLPSGSIASTANNNVACEGDSVLFTATDLNGNPTPYFEFFVNNISTGSASTVSTYTYTPVITDSVLVTVRTWSSSPSLCYDEDSITLRMNSVSGSNSITGSQTICSGEDPFIIANTSIFVADLAAEGAVLLYQWQSRTASTSFTNILGANAITHDPGILSETTAYRRLIYSSFNSVQCNTLAASATSNVVTITADLVSTAVLTSNATNLTVCSGDDLIVDGSTSLNTASYRFYLNGNPLGSGPQSTSSYTINAGTFSDSSSITLRAYQGTLGSGCFNDTSFVIRVNGLTGTNIIGSNQNVCSGETPAAFTSISTPTSDRLSDGAVYTYQWQSRIGSNPYSDIIGANSETFTPSSVTTTTDYQRKVISTYNSVVCDMISASVRVTVDSNPDVFLSAASTSICAGDSVIFTASGAVSYEFFVSGISQGATSTSNTKTISGFTDGQLVTVIGENAQNCFTTSSAVTITVNPIPSGSLSSGLTLDTMCKGDYPIFTATGGTTYEFYVGGVQQFGAGISGNIFNTVSNSLDLTDSSIVSVRVINAGGCSETISSTIRVNGLTGTNIIGSNQNVCSGETPAAFTSISTPTSDRLSDGAVYTYQWQSRIGSNPYSDIIGANSETFTPSSVTTTTDYQRKVISTYNSVVCDMISASVRVTVDSNPDVFLSAASTSICAGDSVIFTASGAVSYEFFVSGISQGATSTSNTKTISGFTDGQLVTVIGENAQNCFTTSSAVTITVNPIPSGSLSSGLTLDTMCKGDYPIFTATGGTTYEFYVGGVQQFGAGISGNIFNTVSNSLDLTDSSIVSVRVINAGGCSETISSTIRVNGLTGANSISGSQTICTGGDPVLLSSAAVPNLDIAGATLSYQWQSKTGANPFSDIVGATLLNYDPSALTTTTIYRRVAYSTFNGVQCPGTDDLGSSNTVTVTVDSAATPVLNFTSGLSNDTLCSNSSVTFDSTGTTGADTFEYFVNGVSARSALASPAGLTYTPPLGSLNDGDQITVRAYLSSIPSCAVEQTITIRVNGLTGTNIIGSNQNVCSGETPAAFTSISTPTSDRLSDGAVYTYQWQSRIGSNPYSDIIGANSETFTPSSVTTTTDYQRKVISTYNSVVCDMISASVRVTVDSNPDVFLSAASTSICAGDSVIFTASGAVSYEFFVSGISQGATSTSNTKTISGFTDGQLVTVIGENAQNCFTTSSAVTITVNPIPSGSLSSGLTLDTMCKGDYPIFTATGGTTYEFYVGGVQQFGAGISGNIFNTVSNSLDLTDSSIVSVRVINAGGCSETISSTIRVNGLTGANSISGSQTICTGGDPVLLSSAAVPNLDIAGATLSYQWQSKTGANPFSDIVGATLLNYDPSALTTTTIYRRVAYSTFNGVQCPGTDDLGSSNTVTVTVDSAATPVLNFTSGLSNDTLCSNSSVTFDSTGTTGADTFEYFVNGVSARSALASPAGLTYTPPLGSLNDGDQITVRAYLSSIPSCAVEQTITIRVNGLTGTNIIGSNQNVCSGETPAAFTSISTPTSDRLSDGAVYTYQWQSRIGSNPYSDIIGANSETFTPSSVTTTTDYQRKVISTYNSVVCDMISASVRVTVDSNPDVFLSAASTSICAGDSVIFTASGAVSYEFFVSGISQGATSTSNTKTISGFTDGQLVTVIGENAQNCFTTSSAVTITVNPIPSGSLSSGLTLDTMCKGDYPIFTATGGTTYEFYVGGVQQFGAGISGNIFNTVSNSLDLTDSSIVSVRVINAGGCSETISSTIRVNGLTGANSISGSQTICTGGDPVLLSSAAVPNLDIAGATLSYQWQSKTGANPFSDIVGATLLNYDPSALTTTTIYRRVAYSTFNGVQCPGTDDLGSSNTVTVTVDSAATPVLNFTSGLSNDTLCSNSSVTFDSTGTTGADTFEYFVNGVSARSALASPAGLTYTPPLGSLNDGDQITVRAYLSSIPSCAVEQTITLTVQGINEPNTISGSQVICSGDIPVQISGSTLTASPSGVITYQWQSRIGADSFVNIIGETLQNYTPSALSTTTAFKRNAISTVNFTSCVFESNTVTVTTAAGPVPVAILSSGEVADTGCAGENFIFDASASTGGLSYEFFVNGISNGIASSVNTASLSLTDGQTVSVNVYPAANGVGCASSQSISVRVNSILGSNFIGGDQTLCVGENPSVLSSVSTPTSSTGTLTFQWQSRSGVNPFVNINGSTDISYDPNVLPVTTIFRRLAISTLNGVSCSNPSNEVTVTVDSSAIVTGTLISDQPSDTVCFGDPGVITFTVNSAAAPITVFFVNNVEVQRSNSQTYTSTQSNFADGDVVKTRILNAAGCYSEQNLIVSVNVATAGSISGAQSICFGSDPLMLTSVTSGTIDGVAITSPGTGNYQWQDSTDGVTWNNILTATSDNYSPTAVLVDKYYRRLTVSSLNGVSCTFPTNSFLVSVDILPIPGLTANGGAISAPATMTSCLNAEIVFIASGGVEYEFFVNGVSIQSRQASQNFSSSSLVDSDEIIVRVYDSSSPTACFDDSGIIDLTIDPLPMASISSSAPNDTFCSSDSVVFTAGSGGAPATYEFLVNGTSFQNSSTNLFDTSDYLITLTDQTAVQVIVSTISGCSSNVTIVLTENGISDFGTLSSTTASVCINDIPDPIIGTTSIASGTMTYQWQSSPDNITYSNINGETSTTLTPTTPLLITTYFKRLTISELNSVVCSSSTVPFKLTVDPPPIPGLISNPGAISAPGTSTLCDITGSASFEATGGASYEFYIDGAVFQARSAVNSFTATTSGTLFNNSKVYVRVFKEITGGCFTDSNLINIVTVPQPVISLTSDKFSNIFCDTDEVIITSTSSVAGSTFDFYVNGTSYQNSISGTFSPTLNAPNAVNGGDVITVIVTTPGGCSSSSSLTMVENFITPPATLTTAIANLCSGDIPTPIIGTTGSASGTISYQWENSTDNITFTNIAGAQSSTYTPTTGITTTTYYRLQTISTLGGIVCQLPSPSIRVQVLPPPIAGITGTSSSGSITGLGNLTVCPGDLVSFSATGGASYEFTTELGVVLQARSTSNTYSSTTLINNDKIRVTVFNQVVNGCSSFSDIITIVDGVAAIISLTTDKISDTFCSGDDIVIMSSSSIASSTFTFYVQGILQSGPSTNSSYTAAAGSIQNLDEVSVIVITPGGCITTSTITLNENLISTTGNLTSASLSICSGDTSSSIIGPTSVASGVISYQWSGSSDNITYTTINGANLSSYDPGILTSTTYFKRKTISELNGVQCESIDTPFIEILVGDSPVLNRTTGGPSLQELCSGDTITPISYEFGGITSSVQIRNLGANLAPVMVGPGLVTTIAGPPNGWYNITSAAATSSFTISGNILNTSVFDVVTILPAGSACPQITETYSIIVSPPAVQPDFIRMDVNQPGYEVLSSAMSNTPAIAALAPVRWYNNTVCQDRLPAPTTASTEFFTCYIDNAFNQQSNQYEWEVTPQGAGNMVNNNFQQTTIRVNEVAALLNGQSYTVTITTASGTITAYQSISSAAMQTADLIGLDLANKINVDAEVTAIYNNVSNQIIIEAAVANTAFTVSAAPLGLGQSIQLGTPVNDLNGITRSGTMQWDQAFSGLATISVRSVGCGGGNSPWTSVQIDVISESVPANPASELNTPIALDVNTCSGGTTGPIPECQIDAFSLPTQFFASSNNAANVNDYASLEWRIINEAPGIGSSVASPGTIAQATGIISWNIGWFGVFDLQVRPRSCDNVLGNWISTTVIIGSTSAAPSISVDPSSALPECPIPLAGFTTLLESDQSVKWYVNSSVGLSDTTSFINTNTLQLTPEANNDLLLDFQPGYSGNVIITAEPDSCPGSSTTYIIQVPEPPTLTLTSVVNSNLQIGSSSVCVDTSINTITYDIDGAANTVTVSGLPLGVNAALQTTPQSTILNFSNTGTAFSANQVYSLNINNSIFSFTTTGGTNSFDDVAIGLRDAVNALTTDFVATYVSPSLSLEVSASGRRGNSYIIARSTPFGNSVAISAPLVTVLQKTLTISGTPLASVIPGLYNYVITTEAPAANCAVVSSTGIIEIEAPATISITSGIANNVGTNSLCNGSSFNPPAALMTVKIQNASQLIVDPSTPLPNGLSLSLSASGSLNEYEVVGQINETVVVPTLFTVNLITVGAVCDEASIQITIEVEPSPVIIPADASLVNQTECSRSPIDPIRFEVFNPAFGLGTTAASVYPNGVTGQLYQQAQLSQFQVNFTVSVADTSAVSDTFTFNINNTLYTYTATATHNYIQLASELNTFLTDQLPNANYSVLYTAGTNVIQIQAVNPGIAFDIISSETSANLGIGNTTVVTPPAYYEISGTPSVTLVVPTDYIYELITSGPSCIGSSLVSGTITINPNTYATYFSGDANPIICDTETIGDIVYNTVGAISAAIVTPTTPSWVSVNFDSVAQSVTISTPIAPSLNVTQTTVYTYQINLIGSIYGCTDTPTPIQGTITVSPIDQISHIITSGSQTQDICVTGNPLAIVPIEYQLSGGATDATVTGLPPGITGNLTVSNTILISGTATQIPSSTFTYNYQVVTTPAACVSATANGSITVFSQPELTLKSTPTSNSQIGVNSICDQTPIETIIYEYSPVPSTMVNFTWTGSNSLNGLGVTASVSGTNQFVIQGTPSTGVTQTTIYTYQIETVGSNCSPEIVLTGSIAINPNDYIVHIPTSGSETQSVCVNNQDNPLTALAENFVNIQYQLEGGASNVDVLGLPLGLGFTITASNTVLISGIVNASATPTLYNYIITTNGSCSNVTANGSIDVLALPTLTLTSSNSTINQTGTNAICDATPIETITYEMGGGATRLDFSWVGSNTLQFSGITSTVSGTEYIISGTPTTGVTQTTIYTYELTTADSGCSPEIILTGRIEVIPNQSVSLISSATTNSQIICINDQISSGSFTSSFTSIEYQLGGGASGAVVTGLPTGIGYTITASNTVLISGSAAPSATSIASPTILYTYTLVTSGDCVTSQVQGTIEVHSLPVMSLTTSSSTSNQVGIAGSVCMNTPIDEIVYKFEGGATGVQFSWISPGPLNGVTATNSGTNEFRISGNPSVNITTNTVYQYQIVTTGSECSPEITLTGSIEVKPDDLLLLTSAVETDNQDICVGGLPVANDLIDITYELRNGAQSASVIGLPPGIGFSINASGTLRISGTAQASASLSSSTISPYIYTVTTIGCSPFVMNGTINIIPKPEMILAVGAEFQEPVCNNTPITPVGYVFNPAAGSNPLVTWPDGRPNGISESLSVFGGGVTPNMISIQGTPNINVSSTTTYRYVITYSGTCDIDAINPDVIVSGSFGVIPTPFIDSPYIIANDVTNVSCFQGNDGSIIIPDDTLAQFEDRIRGGLLSQRQIDEITLTGTTAIGDIISISFGGKTYSYTVKAAVYLNPTPENFLAVSNELADVINNAVAPNQSYATAVPFGSPTQGGIRLTADVGGIALDTSVNVVQTANISNTIVTTQINRALNYSYSWTGPNNFTSSNLSISNLLAGDYFLTVDLNGCSETSTAITVTEPLELIIAISACGGLTGSFEATITGGTPPYTLILEDDNGVQIGPAVVSNGGQVYTGLAVGDDYVLEVTDTTCNLAVREAIEIPTQLLFNHWDLNNGVTDSYCSTSAGNGSISLTRSVGGVFQSAFSGGSNVFSYVWTSSSSSATIGVTPNL